MAGEVLRPISRAPRPARTFRAYTPDINILITAGNGYRVGDSAIVIVVVYDAFIGRVVIIGDPVDSEFILRGPRHGGPSVLIGISDDLSIRVAGWVQDLREVGCIAVRCLRGEVRDPR